MSTGTPCTVILIIWVPMYSTWSCIDFDVSILLASCLASCLISRRLSHIVSNLLVSTFSLRLKLFRASFMVSLLTPVNFWLFISVVNREIVHVLMASIASGTVKNSFPSVNSAYFFFLCLVLVYCIFFFGLLSDQAVSLDGNTFSFCPPVNSNFQSCGPSYHNCTTKSLPYMFMAYWQ